MDPSAPVLTETQQVARLTSSHGKSHFTVNLASGRSFSATLHSKLKNTLWMHRGTFIILEVEGEGETGEEKAVIVGALTKEQIKEMKREGKWPSEFTTEGEPRIIRGGTTVEDVDEDLEEEEQE